eukprot:scaffold224739_cov21-Tisochrysis_lutea.AAC.1
MAPQKRSPPLFSSSPLLRSSSHSLPQNCIKFLWKANARGEVCGVQQSGRQGVDPAALVALMERGAAAGSE